MQYNSINFVLILDTTSKRALTTSIKDPTIKQIYSDIDNIKSCFKDLYEKLYYTTNRY